MALVDAATLARVLDLRSARRVQQLVKDDGMPREARGQYDAQKCALWYIRYLHRTKGGASDERPLSEVDVRTERALKMRADRQRAELELAARVGDVVPVADVLKSDERLFGVIRARVRALRGKWAPRVLGLATMGEATGVLDALADDVLAALVDGAGEVEQDDDTEAAV